MRIAAGFCVSCAMNSFFFFFPIMNLLMLALISLLLLPIVVVALFYFCVCVCFVSFKIYFLSLFLRGIFFFFFFFLFGLVVFVFISFYFFIYLFIFFFFFFGGGVVAISSLQSFHMSEVHIILCSILFNIIMLLRLNKYMCIHTGVVPLYVCYCCVFVCVCVWKRTNRLSLRRSSSACLQLASGYFL